MRVAYNPVRVAYDPVRVACDTEGCGISPRMVLWQESFFAPYVASLDYSMSPQEHPTALCAWSAHELLLLGDRDLAAEVCGMMLSGLLSGGAEFSAPMWC